jgi:hypothetical protein
VREEERKLSVRKGKGGYQGEKRIERLAKERARKITVGREEGRKISERKGKEVYQGKKRIED